MFTFHCKWNDDKPDMEIKFDKKYLEELYLNGKTSDKKHCFQPQITAKYLNNNSYVKCTIRIHPDPSGRDTEK